MSRSLTLIPLLALLLCVNPAVGQDEAPPEPTRLDDARQLMRARQFDAAVKALDQHIADADAADRDEAAYLKARALLLADRYEQAIGAAKALARQFADSPWRYKAAFTRAQAHTHLRQYEQAMQIYEDQAHRLLSDHRKQEIASVIVRFADALAAEPDPGDLGAAQPNYHKAYQLYAKVLEMEISRDLRDRVMYQKALAILQARNYHQAINDFRAYLDRFDPTWTGAVGTATRMAAQMKEKPDPAGEHPLQARYHLAQAQLLAGQRDFARTNAEDLIAMLADPGDAQSRAMQLVRRLPDSRVSELLADSRWLIVRSWNLPSPPGGHLEKAIEAAQAFVEAHPAHPNAVVGAWQIAQAWHNAGRSDQAIAGYRAFIAGDGYRLPEGERATVKLEQFNKSPAELQHEWRMQALYNIGAIQFGQKHYDPAIDTFGAYVNRYPNGPHWSNAQSMIVNARYQVGVDLVAETRYDQARAKLQQFINNHPLDNRNRAILFLFGQIDYQRAQDLIEQADGTLTDDAAEAFHAAIDQWRKLVSKYPNTNEASLALYRIGWIYEQHLDELDKALEAYRDLTFGSWRPHAHNRIQQMTNDQLALRTEKKFRTDAVPQVSVDVRNIDKLDYRRYAVDLEAYFRKAHTIRDIEALDIELIQPDVTREIPIDGYAKYKPITQKIDVPFEEARPGVTLVNVSTDKLQATTLVIRSDLDIIVKASRRQVLVYAQNMSAGQPQPGTRVLISDGKAIIDTGETGEDGVYLASLDELAEVGSIRVFAERQGSVAFGQVELSGMGLTEGLAPRGYIYPDRSAYQPGQTVKLRGVLRDVADGEYTAPAGRTFTLSVTDPGGRLIWQEKLEAGRFGTVHTELPLDEAAPVGTYQVSITPTQQNEAATFTGSFTVQQFQLQKMQLELDTEQAVVFRGEPIQLTLTASYYWGEPVANKTIRYRLPDGREYTEQTDAQGKLVVTYDTSGIQPGQALNFTARIDGESVEAGHAVYLARTGFNIAVQPSRDLVIAGEPVDVTLTTTGADGEPVGRKLTLEVLRYKQAPANPVLAGVPWIHAPQPAAEAVTVQTHDARTDADTGKATVQVNLDAGGRYTLRATGTDRMDNTVTAQNAVTVSDDQDATKLRLFADSFTLKVGQTPTVRLHSRIDNALALVSIEGETIIEHRIVPVNAGFNDIQLDVGHAFYPNVRLSVALLDGRDLHTAATQFSVERELLVRIEPAAGVVEPGANTRVVITVTDQLGRPVQAELSLAVIDEALFALYPDALAAIDEYFEADARRYAEFRADASNDYQYAATTRAVTEAIVAELARLEREQEEARKLRQSQSKTADHLRRERGLGFQDADQDGAGLPGPPRPAASVQTERPAEETVSWENGRRSDAPFYLADGTIAHSARNGAGGGGGPGGGAGLPDPRRELPEAGLWMPAIVTDDQGQANVELTMPQTTTQWRLTSRGVTVHTLAGQATANVITRRPLFVNLKMPDALAEGDQVRPLARVHNTTSEALQVELTLMLRNARAADDNDAADPPDAVLHQQRATVKVPANGSVEHLFEAYQVPVDRDLAVELYAIGGEHRDGVRRELDVQPWGVEYGVADGGVSEADTLVEIKLPGGHEYRSRWMTVMVGPDMERTVIDLALSGGGPRPLPHVQAGRIIAPPRPWGTHAASELLALVSALEYARQVQAPPADMQRLNDEVRRLVQSLVVSQHDDGTWRDLNKSRPWVPTAMGYWALSRARALGFAVSDGALPKARNYLQNRLKHLGDSDRPMVLHALAITGHADFAHLNRLYRERNSLSNPALAYTAMALTHTDHGDYAAELIELLLKKAKRQKVGPALGQRLLVHWDPPNTRDWQQDRAFVTGLAALAVGKIKPDADEVDGAAAWLLQRRGCFGYRPAFARGPVLAALSHHFATARFAQDDYIVTVLVNGQQVAKIDSSKTPQPRLIPIDTERVKDGQNRVEFRMNGRGSYAWAVTLRGFSQKIVQQRKLSPRLHRRHYYHDELTYRGRPIGTQSTSPVRNVEVGQHVRVFLNMYSSSHHGYLVVEEPLPAGMVVLRETIKSSAAHVDVLANRLVFHYPPGQYVGDIHYELVGYASGEFRVGPTLMYDPVEPQRMNIHQPDTLAVLPPGEKSDDPYQMNDSERYRLATLHFNDGVYEQALPLLTELFKKDKWDENREVARMLLWIHTTPQFYDARRIVEAFEVLRERHPALSIPFDKILVVGKAYRDIGEFERSYLVFKATIDISFTNDSNISALLEDEGQFIESILYMRKLWREYPDTPATASTYFALSQAVYAKAPNAHQLAQQQRDLRVPLVEGIDRDALKAERLAMLEYTIELLQSFMTHYPQNPLADDAAFSLANALLDLKMYPSVVELSDVFHRRYSEGAFASSFQYMKALGHFWQRDYDDALGAAKVVADGQTKDRDFARYILGQIYHARGNPAQAIDWYDMVDEQYPDAAQAIDFFKHKTISLEEVTTVRPGEKVALELAYRNIAEARVQVYRVDLMKLYLREKNLANVTQVNLAGIKPEQARTIDLGDGKDYADRKRQVELDLKDEGAYLVIVRGDDLFASGMVLITPLDLEVQEDAVSGRVRVNVRDVVEQQYVAGVHVKAIGTANDSFRSDETDLRGIAIADAVAGPVTVIARDGESRYAFYRGEQSLGNVARQGQGGGQGQQAAQPAQQPDYQRNLRDQNTMIQHGNLQRWEQQRRNQQKGVEVQMAY